MNTMNATLNMRRALSMKSASVAAVLVFSGIGGSLAAQTAPTAEPRNGTTTAESAADLNSDLIGTFGQMAKAAPVVIRGTVLSKSTRLDSRRLIVTDTKFRVDEVISGNFRRGELTLTTLGGRLGNEELEVGHMPQFAVGKNYIVFADPNRETYDPVVGNESGVFQVAANGEVLTYHGARVVGLSGDNLQIGAVMPEGDLAVTPGPRNAGEPIVSGGIRATSAPSQIAAEVAGMSARQFGQAVRAIK